MKKSHYNLDRETISKAGLRITTKQINAQVALDSRIFEFPLLDNAFVMESDLYGNIMSKNSRFLAFDGKHGLIGKPITVETLLRASVTDIRHIVESNIDG